MDWIFAILLFLSSCLLLSWLSSRLIKSLVQIGRFLKLREFVIAFFVMSLATSLPNLFVDFSAIFRGLPEIVFGDIVGGNLVDLTLLLALSTFFTRKGLSTKSRMVQKSAVFTSAVVVLPVLLIIDGNIDRMDGVILIFSFFLYSWWLFSEKDRFSKIYHQDQMQKPNFWQFLKNVGGLLLLLILLLLASQAVVMSAQFFSLHLGISLSLVGLIIVGLGNSFPELYFSVISAKREQNWLVLGELMGSVIVCTTLVLGFIGLLCPFEIKDLSPFFISRAFLVLAVLFSLLFIRSGKVLSKKEGLVLLSLYIAFLIIEVFV